MNVKTYSRRLLNPFHGMLQVIDVPRGIAESSDGRHWKLYVHDAAIVSHTGLSEIRYGSWSQSAGRTRAKVRGTYASKLIEQTGKHLIAALERFAGSVPFDATDRNELWLLDADQQAPLALLETEVDSAACSAAENPRWLPGAAAKTEFVSPRGDADAMARLLSRAAGKRPRALWVAREPSGAGTTFDGDSIPSNCFPNLFIRTDWDRPEDRGLTQDFVRWQAPWLLQLADLGPDMRAWLEPAAWRQPQATNRAFRLYPCLLDQEGLRVTRVKAQLMGESTRIAGPSEPFYPLHLE